MKRFIRNGLDVRRIIDSLEDEDIEDTSVWTHIDFDLNEEDVGIFARDYLEMRGHGNPKNIVSVTYDEEFDKALELFRELLYTAATGIDGAFLVTYKDGHTETLAWEFGGDTIHKVKWIDYPRYPEIKW
ncbi:MAG: hypothetical protein J6Y78_09560 [Paludibacteraceae bacterium]|nr:hypothetical protein [Paludibacteraceae bacterium]